ncbi:predicted protein [Streptomyces lividans TK24]|uniref:Uncharacterized protein n=1 Tax=Streptomyces lividans 1326 TaxID=1200984 RepID=A0A7U9HF51_STRLI|nr:predicted protein [Streptomyces lividans TK24]EOY51423.1 hypothetical protein SLI_6717 [Streptomyces lividans 1326]
MGGHTNVKTTKKWYVKPDVADLLPAAEVPRPGGRLLLRAPSQPLPQPRLPSRSGRQSVLHRNKAGGVDRIARTPQFTTKIRQAAVSQSRYHIEG